MIEVVRTADSPAADDIEERLQSLVVAHTVIVLDSAPAGAGLPEIRDGATTATGSAIPAFLDQLSRDVTEWSRFQSDACYLEDDGTVC